ncbi:MAG: hypothetical protein ABID45_00030 [Patescibacteria group bacterium]
MILALVAIILLMLITVAWAGLSFAPWVPTWKKDIKRAARMIALKEGDVFYDLGCGMGGVVFYFSKKFKCQGKGIEMGMPFYFVAKFRSFFYKNAIIKFGDLFKADLSDANAIFLFGMPDKLGKKLLIKFEKELKKGTYIISYVFPIKGLKPIKVEKPHKRNALYLYKF